MKAKRISYHLLLSLLLPPSLFDLSDQLLHSFGAFGAMGGMLQIDCNPVFSVTLAMRLLGVAPFSHLKVYSKLLISMKSHL